MLNNEKLTLQEIKDCGLKILKFVDSFCRKNNIRYFAACGTMLGAVRHGGYIPWDDDIDLIMFRKDYTRFINEFNTFSEQSRYKCISFEKNDYCFTFAKVIDTDTILVNEFEDDENLGLGIDIFPFDFIDNSREKAYRASKQIKLLMKMQGYSITKKNRFSGPSAIFKYPLAFLSKIIGKKKLDEAIRKKIRNNTCTEYREYCTWYASIETFATRSDYFANTVDIDFEDMKIQCPAKYREYLSDYFGNYMELPPEKDRIPHPQTVYRRK